MKKGYSLVELLLVLSVMAVLSVSAFMIYKKVSEDHKANVEISNITALKSAINILYSAGASNDYGSISNEVLINSQLLPDKMIKNGIIYNEWKGAFIIKGTEQGVVDNGHISQGRTMYSITTKGMGINSCVKLVNYFWNDSLYIGGEYMSDIKSTPDQKKDVGSFASKCKSSNRKGDDLSIILSFR